MKRQVTRRGSAGSVSNNHACLRFFLSLRLSVVHIKRSHLITRSVIDFLIHRTRTEKRFWSEIDIVTNEILKWYQSSSISFHWIIWIFNSPMSVWSMNNTSKFEDILQNRFVGSSIFLRKKFRILINLLLRYWNQVPNMHVVLILYTCWYLQNPIHLLPS